MIKVIELFAGVGSQTQALKNIGVGHEVIGIAEIDKYAISSYMQLHRETHNFGDISKIETLPNADLWTYSFPCQDLSVAGKGAGIKEGTRSGLLLEVERLLETSEKPKYLLMENVKNLVGKKNKPDFDRWCNKLEELGYTNYWQVLNAKDYGVPQNRERVFMISILGKHKPYKFPVTEELKIRLKDILEGEIEEKYYLSDEYVERFKKSKPISNTDIKIIGTTVGTGEGTNCRHWVHDTVGIVGTLSATDYKQPKQILEESTNNIIIAGEVPIANYNHLNKVYDKNGICCTLDTMQGGHRQPKILEEPIIVASRGRNPNHPSDRAVGAPTVQRLEFNTQGICNTLTTVQKDNYVTEPLLIKEATKKGYAEAYEGDSVNLEQPDSQTRRGRVGAQMANTLMTSCNQGVVDNFRIRKLTPRECWRLMGWKDEQFDKIQGISNSQLYKQAGNGIVVSVLEKIFYNLFINGEE